LNDQGEPLDSYVLDVQQNHFNKSIAPRLSLRLISLWLSQNDPRSQIRNPKLEIRNKPEDLNPNWESLKSKTGLFGILNF